MYGEGIQKSTKNYLYIYLFNFFFSILFIFLIFLEPSTCYPRPSTKTRTRFAVVKICIEGGVDVSVWPTVNKKTVYHSLYIS